MRNEIKNISIKRYSNNNSYYIIYEYFRDVCIYYENGVFSPGSFKYSGFMVEISDSEKNKLLNGEVSVVVRHGNSGEAVYGIVENINDWYIYNGVMEFLGDDEDYYYEEYEV